MNKIPKIVFLVTLAYTSTFLYADCPEAKTVNAACAAAGSTCPPFGACYEACKCDPNPTACAINFSTTQNAALVAACAADASGFCSGICQCAPSIEGCTACYFDYAEHANSDPSPTYPCNIYQYASCGLARGVNKPKPESYSTGDLTPVREKTQLFTTCLNGMQNDPRVGFVVDVGACQRSCDNVPDIDGNACKSGCQDHLGAVISAYDLAYDCVASCYPSAVNSDGTIDQNATTACIQKLKDLGSFALQTNKGSFWENNFNGADFRGVYFNKQSAFCEIKPLQLGSGDGSPLTEAGQIDFSNAVLKDSTFDCNPTPLVAKFDGANLSGASFVMSTIGSDHTGLVSFNNATLDNIDAQMATFKNVKISAKTSAKGVDFGGASLSNVTVDNSTLQGNFSDTEIENMIITNSNLTSADPSSGKTDASYFGGISAPAQLDDLGNEKKDSNGNTIYVSSALTISNSTLDLCHFDGANHLTLNLTGSSAKNSFWLDAKLQNATMGQSANPVDLTSADFSGADLTGAHLNAQVLGAKFTNANLTNVVVDLNNYQKPTVTTPPFDASNYQAFNSLWLADLTGATGLKTITSVNPAGEVFDIDWYRQIVCRAIGCATPGTCCDDGSGCLTRAKKLGCAGVPQNPLSKFLPLSYW